MVVSVYVESGLRKRIREIVVRCHAPESSCH